MDTKNERNNLVRHIQRQFHSQHPLVFVEEQSNGGDCYGCGEVVSGPCFSCAVCNYHLHQKCAETPLEIPNHPLHPKHNSGFSLRERPNPRYEYVYGCALCKQKRNIFFYECNVCYFSLDIKCAHLYSSCGKVNPESKYDFHQHPLTFIPNPTAMNELKSLFCSFCHEPVLDAVYVCVYCPRPFILHNKCLDELPELPTRLVDHPSHRSHPLILNSTGSLRFCNPCQNEHYGYFYSCSLCHFNINVECARSRSIVEDQGCHQHPFTILWRQDAFICDACGTQGNFISYICSPCNLMVHKDCTKLPRIIKFSRHVHRLFHKYFVQKQELSRQDCMICFEQVKVERGSYSCVEPGCNYIVHVKCALQNKDLYDVIEQESQREEAVQSSITRVIELNEDGEATKIQHFIHGHSLVLAAEKMEEATDTKCDGCMLPVSTDRFYYCSESECHFYLHKTCAELPINQHWFLQSNTTLQSGDGFSCDLCTRYCSGFFYKMGGYYYVCLRCAKVGDVTTSDGHQHSLSFDFNCHDQPCNGCGMERHPFGAFRCGKGSFTLDFACLTLPHSAPHKCDQHMLYLTYHDDNNYKEHNYCDICEEERDSKLWYYHCSSCDTSAHLRCVLGTFPFIKDGIKWSGFHGHDHDLLFFRKAEGYPKCPRCHKLCLEKILKCKESICNFTIHYHCRYRF